MNYFISHGVAMPESVAPRPRSMTRRPAGETFTAPTGPFAVSGAGGGDTLIGNFGDITFYINNPNEPAGQKP